MILRRLPSTLVVLSTTFKGEINKVNLEEAGMAKLQKEGGWNGISCGSRESHVSDPITITSDNHVTVI